MQYRVWHWFALTIALIAVSAAAIAFGAVALPAADVVRALGGSGDAATVAIVRDIRVPRVLLAWLVGAALGLSGGALQGVLRNGLAEPYLLGVSGGAAVGAVAAFAFGAEHPLVVSAAAFAGAATAVALALLTARAAGNSGRGDPRALLMAGVVIGAFANAVIMIALANAPANTIRGSLWWMMGSAADATWSSVAWLAACAAIGCAALLYFARDIDLLALGEEAAASLGVNTARASRTIFTLAALVAAVTVAAAGLVGFVGLIVPHIARYMGMRTHRLLLGGAALAGAVLVTAADLAARTLRPPAELPLGAITAVLGVPFFLAQLRRAPRQ